MHVYLQSFFFFVFVPSVELYASNSGAARICQPRAKARGGYGRRGLAPAPPPPPVTGRFFGKFVYENDIFLHIKFWAITQMSWGSGHNYIYQYTLLMYTPFQKLRLLQSRGRRSGGRQLPPTLPLCVFPYWHSKRAALLYTPPPPPCEEKMHCPNIFDFSGKDEKFGQKLLCPPNGNGPVRLYV